MGVFLMSAVDIWMEQFFIKQDPLSLLKVSHPCPCIPQVPLFPMVVTMINNKKKFVSKYNPLSQAVLSSVKNHFP